MVNKETIMQVRHEFYARHLTMNAIADLLGINHQTVKRILDLCGRPHPRRILTKTLLQPYQLHIESLLERTPKLRSTRILQILRDKGYKGGLTQLRTFVATIRHSKKQAFLSLTFFPGEQAQVDWASFGSMKVGRSERKLSCFVMTLSYSRATYAAFTFDQTLESFLRCHIQAFRYLKGVPRTLLYDNLKSAVINREGSAIQFNPKLLEMAGHYRFFPKAANVRAGWEKGRVERTIRYIRDNFFAGREFRTIDDANEQLKHWLETVCNTRKWPQDRHKTVDQAWQEEQEKLMVETPQDFQTDYVGPCIPSKICFVRFDCNDYSAPCEYVGRPLTLVASERQIRILDGSNELACHDRSYEKGQKCQNPQHFATIHEQKPKAHARSKRADLIELIPESAEFFEQIINAGRPTGHSTTKLRQYLEVYGRDAVKDAIAAAVGRDICRVSLVGQLLAKGEKRSSTKPLQPIAVPNHPQVKSSTVRPHAFETYDALVATTNSKEKHHG